MIKVIEVIVSSTGETRIETKGFVGPACQEASRSLESALGARASERLTAEFHCERVTPVEKLVQEGGPA